MGGSDYSPIRSASGIRQGRILPLHPYDACTEDISAALRGTGSDCHLHDNCGNSLSYIDEFLLPIVEALQDRGVCCSPDIVHNTNETECIHGSATSTL